jgi:hypothetical protein
LMFDDELLDPIGKHLFTITADPLAAPAESLSLDSSLHSRRAKGFKHIFSGG